MQRLEIARLAEGDAFWDVLGFGIGVVRECESKLYKGSEQKVRRKQESGGGEGEGTEQW